MLSGCLARVVECMLQCNIIIMETTWKVSIDNNEDRRKSPEDKIVSHISVGVSVSQIISVLCKVNVSLSLIERKRCLGFVLTFDLNL